MSTEATLQLKVRSVEALHPLIRRVDLAAGDGSVLPAFTAGAHVRVQVQLPGGELDWRHYSLVNLDTAEVATQRPRSYTLAVRLEPEGRGGSRFMHQLKPGDAVTVQAPRNEFALTEHRGTTLLVAGGIGVTPLTAMPAERKRQRRPVRMVYASRSREQMAFLSPLRELLGNQLSLHADQDVGRPLDLASLLDTCGPDDVLYVCGPQPMLDSILAGAQARGWARERVKFEIFSAPAAQSNDHAFDLVLNRSGQTLRVASDQTILDCVEMHGFDALSDCRRGECGVCVVDVVEGEVDHRDHVLSSAEKSSGKVIQICVSRAKGQRLVLDL